MNHSNLPISVNQLIFTSTSNFRIAVECSTTWVTEARHSLVHVRNTDSGGIYLFLVKMTFEISTVGRQQHLFSTHGQMFLRKCRSFLWKIFRPRGKLNSQPSDSCRMLYHFSYRGQTFSGPCLKYRLSWYIFVCKVNITAISYRPLTKLAPDDVLTRKRFLLKQLFVGKKHQ